MNLDNPEKTEKNIEKLAKEAVNQMDMDILIEYAEGSMEVHYKKLSDEDFTEAWTQVFGED